MPFGGDSLFNSCDRIAKARVGLIQQQISELNSKIEQNRIETEQTKNNIELSIINACIELKRNAQIQNQYAQLCANVTPSRK
jgi:TolA-binding protein